MTNSEAIEAALVDCVRARAKAIDADPQLASLTLVVNLQREGGVKMVLYRTESHVKGVQAGVRLPA